MDLLQENKVNKFNLVTNLTEGRSHIEGYSQITVTRF